MSDANRVSIAYVPEVTYATSPGTQLTELRYRGESLKQATEKIVSDEIRADRETSDVIRTAIKSNGSIDGRFSYGAYDPFLEAALMSATWTAPVNIAAVTDNVTITASGNNFLLTRTVGSWVVDGFSLTADVGKWIRISGFATNEANNDLAKIVSVTATVLTVSHIAMVPESDSSTNYRIGGFIKGGTTFRSFWLEKAFLDLSNEFAEFPGSVIDTWEIKVAVKQIIECNFGFIGQKEVSASATTGTGTNAASPTNPIMNAVDNVTGVMQSGLAVPITSFGLKLSNNARERLRVGLLGAESIGMGSIGLSGNIEGYYSSKTIFDRYLNFSDDSIALKLKDNVTIPNRYVIDVPRLKLTDGVRTGGGINTDVIAKYSFDGFLNASELQSIRITRFATP